MSDAVFAALRRHLLTRYDDLKARLTRRLGSADLAGDVLHDTWLRLAQGGEIAGVRHADAYLFQTAVNIARDRRRAEARRLTAMETDALLGIADDSPSPSQVAETRSDLRALMTVLAELPTRQRTILLAARLEGAPRREIALRYRISVRLVQRELQEAQDYCAARLRRLSGRGFTSDHSKTSETMRPHEIGTSRPPVSET
ncbi:MAG: RNA polymerase sigma factor [Rhodoplanes sp.]|uniref:RNA polymerase sigma factor n=1 Tax=Rhodoplanes sp. TaxID=1968906 RepID=UPI0017F70059|nr:RNA polymerase sigma factor [Rhodoplanes sp.]NVO17599.1 RNA polymerase sigma factor [Rhodoplanes sp.]